MFVRAVVADVAVSSYTLCSVDEPMVIVDVNKSITYEQVIAEFAESLCHRHVLPVLEVRSETVDDCAIHNVPPLVCYDFKV